MKITIESCELDVIDKAELERKGIGVAGTSVAVTFNGRLSASEFGAALGACINAWLENVKIGPSVDSATTPTAEQRELIIHNVMVSMAIAMHSSVRATGGLQS